MDETGKKILIGCGIGCGVIVVLFLLLCGTGAFLVKDTIQSFRATEVSNENLVAVYGQIEDYCPPADGRISAERIETFLAVRSGMDSIYLDMEKGIDDFTQDIRDVQDSDKSFWKIVGIIRKGFSALPGLANFYTVRNEALLEAGMGDGEYLYLYITIYYAYLGKSITDGPEFKIFGRDENGNRDWSDDESETVEEVQAQREDAIITKSRRLFLIWLDCQLESLEASGDSGRAWKRALVKEIDALETDRHRLVWEDGLPSVIRESLEPYHDRLMNSYIPLLNPFEVNPDN